MSLIPNTQTPSPELTLTPHEGVSRPHKHIHLITWDRNLTKRYTLRDWAPLRDDILALTTHVPGESVYMVHAKQNEEVVKKLIATDEAWELLPHCEHNHYGNTKGRNTYRDMAAIALTSVQFKRDEYYQLIAFNMGKGVIPATPTRRGKKDREFANPTL